VEFGFGESGEPGLDGRRIRVHAQVRAGRMGRFAPCPRRARKTPIDPEPSPDPPSSRHSVATKRTLSATILPAPRGSLTRLPTCHGLNPIGIPAANGRRGPWSRRSPSLSKGPCPTPAVGRGPRNLRSGPSERDEAFRAELRRLGYVEGQNLAIVDQCEFPFVP